MNNERDMKTKAVIFIAVLACVMLTACGSTDVISGYSSGDVKLGQYKEVTYEALEVSVTDEQVMEKVNSELISVKKQDVDVEGRTVVEDGDTIKCHFTGYIDGEPFDGGSSEDSEIIVGAGSMIPGFEEGIIGAEIGVEKEIDVTFPEDYQLNSDLAGKPAVFKLTVDRIIEKKEPEYTDEFVAANTDCSTVQEYNEKIRSELLETEQKKADTKKKYDLMLKIIRASEFDKQAMAPQIISERQSIILKSDNFYQQVLNVDSYTYYNQYMGMTADEINEYFDAFAKMQVEYNFVLAAVADKENITVTDAEIDEYAEKLRSESQYETLEDMYSDLQASFGEPGRTVVAAEARNNKALDLIMSTALAN